MRTSEHLKELATALVSAQARQDRHAESRLVFSLFRTPGDKRFAANGSGGKSDAARFYEKLAFGISDCWYWIGNRDHSGYGRTNSCGQNFAHRLSWVLHKGEIPDGMKVLHRCDVPSCVNPDHLFLGTQADNVADMVAKNRNRSNPRRGCANHLSKLNDEQVKVIRDEFASGGTTQRNLAVKYGVSNMTISRIVNGKSWVM